ncbi:MAG: DMT family transporter [Phycisphaeraceae bacterium]|nr:DMT family transporter [Phycisphaeraceae bacterium]
MSHAPTSRTTIPATTPSPAATHQQLTGVVLVVLTLVGWSSIPLFLRHFAEDIDGWTSNGWRYGFAALLWLPVLLVAGWRRKLPPRLFALALVPAAFNIVGQVCFTWAHYLLDPGMLTFALRAHIVFVTIGAALLFASERAVIRRPLFLIGIVLVVGGTSATILLAPDKPSTASQASGVLADSPAQARALGVALSIAAGAFFACYALGVRKCMAGVNSIVAFAAISQYTALAMIALMLPLGVAAGLTALPSDWHGMGALTLSGFGLLLLSSVIGIALGHVGYYMAIGRLGVAVTSGVIQLQPFVVSIASLLLFKELLTGGQWVAGAVAVCGAGSMLWSQHRAHRGKPPLLAWWKTQPARAGRVEDLPADHVAAAAMASDDTPEPR